MTLKVIRYKAVTSGRRHLVNLEKAALLKDDSVFKVSFRYNSRNGKSIVNGHITAWHRGAGHKRLYRNVNLMMENRMSLVLGVIYDPYRSCLTSVNFDLFSKKFFSMRAMLNFFPGLLVKELSFRMLSYYDQNNVDRNFFRIYSNRSTGKKKYSSDVLKLFCKEVRLKLGYSSFLHIIPIGSMINSISIKNKVTYTRSAGAKAQLIKVQYNWATVKLSTGKLVKISADSMARVGIVSNDKHRLLVYGKAGRKRNLGRRPIVRGIAMNPVDHPHGGRTNGGRPSVTPWGILTKCKFKLRKNKKLY